MSAELTRLSATRLVTAYRRKEISPVEVTRAVIDGIEAFDSQVNAFCVVDGAHALDAARASEARWQRGAPMGLVDGVPTTIKDVVLSAGWPTLRGSLAVPREQDWSDDAPVTGAPARAWCRADRQDHDPGVRLEGRHRQRTHGHHTQPLEHRSDPRRQQRRRGGGLRPGPGRPAHRHRRRRLPSHPGRIHRRVRIQNDLWPGTGLARESLRHPCPRGTYYPHGHRHGP